MNVKNFLKPSDYVMFVPNGLPLTIQYGEQGLVQKFFIDWDCNKLANTDITTALSNLGAMKLFPTSIPVKNGTSWVKGVLASDELCKSPGMLPDCTYSELLELLSSGHIDGWHFYAGSISSLATTFGGANSIFNWLKMNKFTVLPSKLVPVNPGSDTFSTAWGDGYTIDEASSVFIYSQNKFEVKSLEHTQFRVNSMDLITDQFGVIKYILKSEDGKFTKVIDYADAVEHRLTTNSLVVFDGNRLIKCTRLDKHKRKTLTLETTCPICKKKLTARIGQELVCSDAHCKSKWYPQICQMVKAFNLPDISYESFTRNSDKILCLADILDIESYCKGIVKVSLGRILEAVVPQKVVRNPQILHEFVNKCNNDVDQIMYYVTNPSKISEDFQFVSSFNTQFIQWLTDKWNQTEISALINSEHIQIINCDKSFDGPPIFRNKVICLTGTFSHGDYVKIANILQSYGAEVEYKLSERTNGLLVGDILEKVNGHFIQICKNSNIPVMPESEFFARYEIDKDLATHLV